VTHQKRDRPQNQPIQQNSREGSHMTSKKKKEDGAQFVRYFGPLLDALRGLGGSAKPDEAVDRVSDDLKYLTRF
jgi:hypothetical protein